MARLRPSGSGAAVTAHAFLRPTATPTAALLVVASGPPPDGWPATSGSGASDSQLAHAVGWVCEVRRDHVVVLNPLGEGLYRASLPDLDDAWIHDVRAGSSAAVYVLPAMPSGVDDPAAAVDLAALDGPVTAATVRTAVADDYGRAAPVGRNAPCPCGSGKKFKHCHGK
jgi:hypothetical protein